jgi:hypothetical protein
VRFPANREYLAEIAERTPPICERLFDHRRQNAPVDRGCCIEECPRHRGEPQPVATLEQMVARQAPGTEHPDP